MKPSLILGEILTKVVKYVSIVKGQLVEQKAANFYDFQQKGGLQTKISNTKVIFRTVLKIIKIWPN